MVRGLLQQHPWASLGYVRSGRAQRTLHSRTSAEVFSILGGRRWDGTCLFVYPPIPAESRLVYEQLAHDYEVERILLATVCIEVAMIPIIQIRYARSISHGEAFQASRYSLNNQLAVSRPLFLHRVFVVCVLEGIYRLKQTTLVGII